MKKLLLFLSFLLFNSFLSFAAETPNPVRDIDGEEIRTGVEYYILPTFCGEGGGGITYGRSTRNETFPLAVVQAQWDLDRGLPVTFKPVNPEEGVVRVSTNLNIKFSNMFTRCIQSNVWNVDFDAELQRFFILNNGVEGNPGCDTFYNWFQIVEASDIDYKLVFHPTICSIVEVPPIDVGIFLDHDGTRRLGLRYSVPFRVRFFKARSMQNENILKSVIST